MKDSPITTGRAAGICNLTQKTMRRYIKLFPEFFSSEACKVTRGRRFTAQDLNNLQIIRRLFYDRQKIETIRAALRGEWTSPAKSLYQLEDITGLIENARLEIEQAEMVNNKAIELSSRSDSNLYHMNKKLIQIIDQLDKVRKDLEALRSEVSSSKPVEPLKKKQPGFLGIVFGGGDQ